MTKNDLKTFDKYALTITEAAEYFGIGQTRLRELVQKESGADWYFSNGIKTLIKRKKFESYLDAVSAI